MPHALSTLVPGSASGAQNFPTLLRSLLLSKVICPSSDSSRSLAALRAFLAMLPAVSAHMTSPE